MAGLSLARRQQLAISIGLAGVTLLAWIQLLRIGRSMDASMEAAMASGAGCELHPWSGGDFTLAFAMWAVMMVGMMVPSAAPMSLLFAAVSRKARAQGSPVAPTFVFVAGYLAVWTFFSALATGAQWGLERMALLSPMLVASTPVFGGALLVAAGAYQWTPWKDACLARCRAPATFLAMHWRPGLVGAFRAGLAHGVYCLGCCWLLMGLLFFGGVMNLLWIAGLAVFALLERLVPRGHAVGRLAGAALILVGGAELVTWLAGSA
jgi:predicted metal-binding membrane protein